MFIKFLISLTARLAAYNMSFLTLKKEQKTIKESNSRCLPYMARIQCRGNTMVHLHICTCIQREGEHARVKIAPCIRNQTMQYVHFFIQTIPSCYFASQGGKSPKLYKMIEIKLNLEKQIYTSSLSSLQMCSFGSKRNSSVSPTQSFRLSGEMKSNETVTQDCNYKVK